MSVATTSRVGHVVAVVPHSTSLLETTRSALEFAKMGAWRMTILLVADLESGLEVLDSACRRLATLVRDYDEEACTVRLVVRHGPADQALADLAARESLDLVLAPAEVEIGNDPGCPLVPLGAG